MSKPHDSGTEIKELKAERDMWFTRATALFYMLPVDTKIADIQANMDPAHRDRVAFVRVCSGRQRLRCDGVSPANRVA